ncbi:twin-arginine translocase TatA/TatE family subunit [Pleurocapsa sp. CCALA 161]|uniref:TatA/E family twin arginine-targeting protein translocase n=1 Tax=Pleurocapsa sp. CCALA 161 TaxID=2107688 RepID=UPI000D06E692|nr:TatA/E family twin arginine-targeting protein translocase [Pleurocapsa sp. CCALA 161]PSB08338.1 twin-arginine translocase TatA/TatE family subunit [Pleurocapsa sp. CCALA 161]
MNIFGIGLPEMALITIVALLVFGPKKLPEIGRSVAKTLRSFQDASKEFENEFKKEAASIEKSISMNAQIEGGSEQKSTEPTQSISSAESDVVG